MRRKADSTLYIVSNSQRLCVVTANVYSSHKTRLGLKILAACALKNAETLYHI
jgi:hypothetical protein